MSKDLERVLVIAENSESMDAITLAAEVRRLRRMEARVVELLGAKKQALSEIRSDMDVCLENDWDEGHERLVGEESRALAEINVLERIIND